MSTTRNPYKTMLEIAEKDTKIAEKELKVPSYLDLNFFFDGKYKIETMECVFIVDCSINAKEYHHAMLQHIYQLTSYPVLSPNHPIHTFYIKPTESGNSIEYKVYNGAQPFIYELQRIQYYNIAHTPNFEVILKTLMGYFTSNYISFASFVHLMIFYDEFISSGDNSLILTLLETMGSKGTTFFYAITSVNQAIDYSDFALNTLSHIKATIETISNENGQEIKIEVIRPFITVSFKPPLFTQQDLSFIPRDVLQLHPLQLEESEDIEGLIVRIEPKYFLSDECYEFYSRPTLYRVQPTVIHKHKYPFAQGGIRNAYHGTNKIDKKEIVLKDFIVPSASNINKYLHSLELNCAVDQLASEFNQVCGSYKRINFVPTHLFIECDQKLIGKPTITYEELMFVSKKRIYFVEPKLDGCFVKFNDNADWVNYQLYSATIQAFSHWTFFRTAKRLIVVDLQGIINKEKNEYLLTDPAVHHESLSKYFFSSTNHGQKGFYNFFRSHSCNSVCKELGIVGYDVYHQKGETNEQEFMLDCPTNIIFPPPK